MDSAPKNSNSDRLLQIRVPKFALLVFRFSQQPLALSAPFTECKKMWRRQSVRAKVAVNPSSLPLLGNSHFEARAVRRTFLSSEICIGKALRNRRQSEHLRGGGGERNHPHQRKRTVLGRGKLDHQRVSLRRGVERDTVRCGRKQWRGPEQLRRQELDRAQHRDLGSASRGWHGTAGGLSPSAPPARSCNRENSLTPRASVSSPFRKPDFRLALPPSQGGTIGLNH
jgi:hypothetical protein